MSNTICICCAGRMTAGSPRNPNICPGCEQLLEDDCAELERLLTELDGPAPINRVAGYLQKKPAAEEENHESVQTDFHWAG